MRYVGNNPLYRIDFEGLQGQGWSISPIGTLELPPIQNFPAKQLCPPVSSFPKDTPNFPTPPKLPTPSPKDECPQKEKSKYDQCVIDATAEKVKCQDQAKEDCKSTWYGGIGRILYYGAGYGFEWGSYGGVTGGTVGGLYGGYVGVSGGTLVLPGLGTTTGGIACAGTGMTIGGILGGTIGGTGGMGYGAWNGRQMGYDDCVEKAKKKCENTYNDTMDRTCTPLRGT
jgi:hypothetical protein